MPDFQRQPESAAQKPFLNREIALWKAALIVAAALVVVIASMTAIGQRYFWRPSLATPQERGLAYYQALVEKEPSPENWVNLGWHFYQSGDYTQALECYDQALSLDPDHFAALLNTGLTYLQLRHYDSAREYLEKGVQIESASWEAHLYLGLAYIGQEKWDAAAAALSRSLELNRHVADTHYYLGYVAEQQGDLDNALESYREALRYNPDSAEAQEGLARLEGAE